MSAMETPEIHQTVKAIAAIYRKVADWLVSGCRLKKEAWFGGTQFR
jgi:hypothetical protein